LPLRNFGNKGSIFFPSRRASTRIRNCCMLVERRRSSIAV
jgi:hypothetical protein